MRNAFAHAGRGSFAGQLRFVNMWDLGPLMGRSVPMCHPCKYIYRLSSAARMNSSPMMCNTHQMLRRDWCTMHHPSIAIGLELSSKPRIGKNVPGISPF